MFIWLTLSLSIDKIAKELSLVCDIVDLKYVFINLSLEKLRSAPAEVIGRVKNNW